MKTVAYKHTTTGGEALAFVTFANGRGELTLNAGTLDTLNTAAQLDAVCETLAIVRADVRAGKPGAKRAGAVTRETIEEEAHAIAA